MTTLTIGECMSPLPQTVEVDQPLSVVAARMEELGSHHLPVMSRGALVGVISAHDVEKARLLGLDITTVSAGVAMTAGPYVVSREFPLSRVARTMAERQVGSALVMDGERVTGILTVNDALSILAELAEGASPSMRQFFPASARERIRHEHEIILAMLSRVQHLADQVLGEDDAAAEDLQRAAEELYRTLLRHIDLEDTLLVPALREIPTSGPTRAERLLNHHKQQRAQLHMAMSAVRGDPEHLARSISSVVAAVRDDIEQEDKEILTSQLLHDDAVLRDAAGG